MCVTVFASFTYYLLTVVPIKDHVLHPATNESPQGGCHHGGWIRGIFFCESSLLIEKQTNFIRGPQKIIKTLTLTL